MCDNINPFTLRLGTDTSSDVDVYPDICYGDIASYLVFFCELFDPRVNEGVQVDRGT